MLYAKAEGRGEYRAVYLQSLRLSCIFFLEKCPLG